MFDEQLVDYAEQVLFSWYVYTKKWRPRMGAPGIAPYCRQFRSSRQYDTTHALSERFLSRHELERVDWCISNLPVPHQIAIGKEMSVRYAKRYERREKMPTQYVNTGTSYEQALNLLLPILKKDGVFYVYESKQ